MSPTRLEDNLCIGIDVGGTFTDSVLTGLAGRVVHAKALTTLGDLGQGVMDACTLLAERADLELKILLTRVKRFGLGTTAVTNVLAASTGRRVGLLTTRGFEDLLPMALGRWDSDSGWLVRPRQIVDRQCIVGIGERVDCNGRVVTALNEEAVVEAASMLVGQHHVEAFAVSFLWSFSNPAHELRTSEIITQLYPDIPVMVGSSLLPVLREYERTTFAVLNAYTSGALCGIDRLVADLTQRGLEVPVLLVHSAGGTISVDQAHQTPILLAKSGPAAGVAAAVAVAPDQRNLVAFDMGGTSLDIAVIEDGEPSRRLRGDIGGVHTALSAVDIDSVGAGGGSIAWIDAIGALRVGPRSAGASPGPACYGRGGSALTVTDALLILGFLDGERFLGGRMDLDIEAARLACTRLADGSRLSIAQLAWGVREVAIAGMAVAVRSRLARRGIDPRLTSILSYGGCGGLFAAEVATEIGVTRVLIPGLASVLSAFGAARADVRRERVATIAAELESAAELIPGVIHNLKEHVLDDLEADGVAPPDRYVTFETDMRIGHQKWEIAIPLHLDDDNRAEVHQLIDDFEREYVRRYGSGAFMTAAPIELATVRAIGVGRTKKTPLATSGHMTTNFNGPQELGQRDVRWGQKNQALQVPVADAADMSPGKDLPGPALVDGLDTTVWIPPGMTGWMDPTGLLTLEAR